MTKVDEMTFDGADLAHALRQVRPAVGTDRKRPQLHGVLVDARDGRLRLAATDSHRLVVRELRAPATLELSAVITAAAVDDALGWLPDAGAIDLRADGTDLVAGDRTLAGLPDPFPDIDRILARPGDARRFTTSRTSLLDVLRSLPDCDHAALRFTATELVVEAEDVTLAVPGALDGDEITVHANPAYLVDAADAFGTDEITLEVAAPTAPIAVTAGADQTLLTLVMPVRTR